MYIMYMHVHKCLFIYAKRQEVLLHQLHTTDIYDRPCIIYGQFGVLIKLKFLT